MSSPTPLDRKSSVPEIRDRFDGDVERFSNLETGQTATIDAALAMSLITEAAVRSTPEIHRVLDIGCGAGNNTIRLRQVYGLLTWLSTLPFVDGDRIAFYGLSYGGETAIRVPPVPEKYGLSICSGDFNQWTRKVASTDQQFSFMRTIEWEMPYWNLGHTFDYAKMTYLMSPRPFMVERGHHDGVGRDQWVAHEFAKVRFLYAQFGMSDQVDIEFFQGGHSINGQGTFDFLHKHLNWPVPDSEQ